MPEERLQKILARAGVASRRSAETLITSGRVTVDGQTVTELGVCVDPERAVIRVDGQPVADERHRYVMLHKPSGYLSGQDVRAHFKSWHELVRVPERLYAVGRLDQDSEGLLLLTNDGDVAFRLIHPRFGHAKTYLVQVEGTPDARKLRRWQHGVMLDDGPTAPAQVTLLRQPPMPFAERSAGTRRTSWLQFTLHEGRKRQIRRMVSLLGHPALRVIRTGLGPLQLGELKAGQWRDLTDSEVRMLLELARRAGRLAATEARIERKKSTLVPATIAIDGPAASGKSTIGALVAQELGYLYFDTGVMYRAITRVAIDRGVPIDDEAAVARLAENVRLDVLPPTVQDGRDVTVLADGQDITPALRGPEVERSVSPVSAYPGVRQALTVQQRRIAEPGGIVMVGRDIGTVVLPDADLKIFLDATLTERANRRHRDYQQRGLDVPLERVLADLRRRDEYDSGRKVAPLRPARGAVMIDSTSLSIEEVVARVRHLIERWGRYRTSGARGRPGAAK